MTFAKDYLKKMKNTVTVIGVIYVSDCIAISEHLIPKFLLRSMPPESLDNTSNSFLPKLRTLGRTLSFQNMRGETKHNRLSSSNPLVEKGDMLYLKTSVLGVCSNSHFKCQASHDPFAAQ